MIIEVIRAVFVSWRRSCVSSYPTHSGDYRILRLVRGLRGKIDTRVTNIAGRGHET